MPSNCVCPLYRYAQFPTYSSYYSKRCVDNVVSYVSYDCPDVGPYPMYNCTASACDAGCDSFIDDDQDPNYSVFPTIGANGLQGHMFERGFEPRFENEAARINGFVAKLVFEVPGAQLVLFAKLFVVCVQPSVRPSVGPRDRLRMFGIGQETTANIHFDPLHDHELVVTPTDFRRIGSYCIRFTIKRDEYPELVLIDTAFQVITSTPIT